MGGSLVERLEQSIQVTHAAEVFKRTIIRLARCRIFSSSAKESCG